MAASECGTPVKGSGSDYTLWTLEWTYTDAGGAVSLDTAQSDRDVNIPSPVVDSGTAGKTNIQFPRCKRVWPAAINFEPPSGDLDDGTDYRLVEITERNPAAGTAVIRFVDVEGSGNLVDPTSGARVTLTLRLERP